MVEDASPVHELQEHIELRGVYSFHLHRKGDGTSAPLSWGSLGGKMDEDESSLLGSSGYISRNGERDIARRETSQDESRLGLDVRIEMENESPAPSSYRKEDKMSAVLA